MMGWILLILTILVVLWPERGLYVRWRRHRRIHSRQALEDALMHIHRLQHEGRPASIELLSGALRMPPRNVLELINRMENQGLLTISGNGIHLSGEGRRWALQVIRAHRLFERYLADETSVPMVEVHCRAHQLEHTVSPDEVDKMDADMGHPAFDPQGDPIPDAAGEVHDVPSYSLVDWPANAPAQIVHIEDEPPAVYAQIVAEGLAVGMEVVILETTPTRLVIEAGGMEHLLAPVVATNIAVRQAPAVPFSRRGRPLTALKTGERGRVAALDPACRGLTRRRFLDLGITPGVRIEPVMRSAFRDPTAYRVRDTLIALRREQADLIWIEEPEMDRGHAGIPAGP